MCSHFCKVQRPVQAFLKAKMKLLSFTGFHYLVLYSCQNDKGTRLRDYRICFVERRYHQLRGLWRQVAPRNVPMSGLNAESAIASGVLPAEFTSDVVSGCISIHSADVNYLHIHLWFVFSPVHRKSSQLLPSHRLLNMKIPPKTSLLQYWPHQMIYSCNISAYLSRLQID